MEELIRVENGQIILQEKVIRELHEFQVLKARMDMQEKEIKAAMLKAMKENGIRSFENDDVRITLKDAYTRVAVDSDALKEQGLYELFTKQTPVKESVSISWK